MRVIREFIQADRRMHPPKDRLCNLHDALAEVDCEAEKMRELEIRNRVDKHKHSNTIQPKQ